MEFFNSFVPYAKLIGVGIGGLSGMIALAALMYTLRAAFEPSWRVVQWMFGHSLGQKPGSMNSGIIYGARMLAWAGVIGAIAWLFLRGIL
jgi:hypothetical protein